MNKALIKKYKAEFDYWLYGGELSYLTNSKSEWITATYIENVFSLPDIKEIIINDEYIVLRKALCEGKTIQISVNGITSWYDCNKPALLDFKPYNTYRIKPEEPRLKVGDWVTELGTAKPRQLTKNYIDAINTVGSWGDFSLWQPDQNEWYVDNANKELLKCDYVEYVENELYVYGTTAKGYPFNSKLADCAPFIGELPSFIKENSVNSSRTIN